MTRRSRPPAGRSWQTIAVCCALALLTAGEPTNPFLAVRCLLAEPTPESEPTREEEGETGKLAASVQTGRRSFRKRSGSLPGHHRQATLSPRTDPSRRSNSLTPTASPVGELAFRNGVGAPLRC